MTRALATAVLVALAGCAAEAAPPRPRWAAAELSLCADDAQLHAPLQAAAAAWQGVAPALRMVDPTAGPCDVRVGYGPVPSAWGAATLRQYSADGRAIVRATIFIDGDAPVGDASIDPAAVDLQSVLTHELGHALGIRHVEQPHATMFEAIDAGDTSRRELSPEDVDAARELYE